MYQPTDPDDDFDVVNTLVDEIALNDEELRSLAVTTLSDEPEWDDVTHLLGATGDEA